MAEHFSIYFYPKVIYGGEFILGLLLRWLGVWLTPAPGTPEFSQACSGAGFEVFKPNRTREFVYKINVCPVTCGSQRETSSIWWFIEGETREKIRKKGQITHNVPINHIDNSWMLINYSQKYTRAHIVNWPQVAWVLRNLSPILVWAINFCSFLDLWSLLESQNFLGRFGLDPSL